MIGRGRPRKKESRNKGYRIRLSEEEFDELAYVSEFYSIPKSEIIRKAIKMYCNLVRNGVNL